MQSVLDGVSNFYFANKKNDPEHGYVFNVPDIV